MNSLQASKCIGQKPGYNRRREPGQRSRAAGLRATVLHDHFQVNAIDELENEEEALGGFEGVTQGRQVWSSQLPSYPGLSLKGLSQHTAMCELWTKPLDRYPVS